MADTTLAQQVNTLATRVGTEIKAVKRSITETAGQIPTDAEDIAYGNYGKDTIKAALDDLLYQKISISSFTNSVNTAEMGSTIDSVILNWNYNKTPTKLELDEEVLTPTDKTKTLSGQAIKANKTWTLKATDERSAVATRTTSIQFLNGVYYGVGTVDADRVTNEFVLGLTKQLTNSKARDITVTANAGQYIYYILPSRLGTPTFFVGGFEGGFSLIKSFDVTNASGYTEDYNVYRSENAGLGKTTVTIK